MKRLVLTFLWASVTSLLFSQYGFMGKTISLNYSFNTSLALRGPTFNGGSIGLNGTHEISLLKVLNRKNELGLFGGYARSSVDYTGLNGSLDKIPEEYLLKVKMITAGLHYKKYLSNGKRWNLAPLGSYLSFKPMISSVTIFSFDEKYKFSQIVYPGFSFGMGRQNIFFNRLLVSFGIEFSLPLLSPRLLERIGEEDQYYRDDIEPNLDRFKIATVTRMNQRSLFMFTFGIGILAK